MRIIRDRFPLGPPCRVYAPAQFSKLCFRRLGTSLRTYRRRVAELMTALEAGSRFQAGVRAGELGLAR